MDNGSDLTAVCKSMACAVMNPAHREESDPDEVQNLLLRKSGGKKQKIDPVRKVGRNNPEHGQDPQGGEISPRSHRSNSRAQSNPIRLVATWSQQVWKSQPSGGRFEGLDFSCFGDWNLMAFDL
jgi:hypothetical protein